MEVLILLGPRRPLRGAGEFANLGPQAADLGEDCGAVDLSLLGLGLVGGALDRDAGLPSDLAGHLAPVVSVPSVR